MIIYWVQATPENAKHLGVNSGWVNKHNMFVVNQIGREIEGIQIVSDYVKQQILDQGFIPEYKYHEKTKQFIPANSKLFEEQEKSVVKEDFKIEVGTVALVQENRFMTAEERKLIGKEVEILSEFKFNSTCKVTALDLDSGSFVILDKDMLTKPLSEQELKVKQIVKQYTPAIEVISSDFGITPEELAEFLINKQNNQETK